MWSLETEWYELVIRAASVFIFVFVLLRVWGKKHFSHLTPFDFVLLLIISEAVQNALVKDDKSIPAGFITILTLVGLNVILSKLSFHNRKVEKILEGTPQTLIKDGMVNELLMKKETMTEQELNEALRMQGVSEVDEVAEARLEANGTITVIRKKDESIIKKLFH